MCCVDRRTEACRGHMGTGRAQTHGDPEGLKKGSGCVGTSWRMEAGAEHGMVSACGP